jgi:hypothetical protein
MLELLQEIKEMVNEEIKFDVMANQSVNDAMNTTQYSP